MSENSNNTISTTTHPTIFDAAEALYSNIVNNTNPTINRSESGFAIIFTILYHIRDLATTIIASEPLDMVGSDLERETFLNVRQVFVELRDQNNEQDIKVGLAVEKFLNSLSKLLDISLTDIINLDIIQVWNKIVQVLTAVMPPFHDIFLGHIPSYNIAFHYVIPHYIQALFTSELTTLDLVLRCCLDKARYDYESDAKNNENMSNAIIIHRAPEILVVSCESTLNGLANISDDKKPTSIQFPDTLDLSIYQTKQSNNSEEISRIYDLIAIVSQDNAFTTTSTSYLRLPQDNIQNTNTNLSYSPPTRYLHTESVDYLVDILTNGIKQQPIISLESEKQRISELKLQSEYRDMWVKATDAKGPLTNEQALQGNYYSCNDPYSHVPQFLLYVKRGLSNILTRLKPYVSKAGQCRAMGDMSYALASSIDSFKEARKYYEQAISYDPSYKELLSNTLVSLNKIDSIQQSKNLEEQGDISLVNHRLKESYDYYYKANEKLINSLTELKDLNSITSIDNSLQELPNQSTQLIDLKFNNFLKISTNYDKKLKEKCSYIKYMQSLEMIVHCIEKGEEAIKEKKYNIAKEHYNSAINFSNKTLLNHEKNNEKNEKFELQKNYFLNINLYIQKVIDVLLSNIKMDEANIAMKEGKYRLANQLYNEAISLDNSKAIGLESLLDGFVVLIQCEDAFIKYRLGMTSYEEKNYSSCISYLTEAINLLPNDRINDLINFLNDRGQVYNDIKEYQLALDDFNRVIELKSDNAIAYFRKGGTLFLMNQYDESIKSYNQANIYDTSLSSQIKVKLRQINTAKEVQLRKEREAERARIKEEERKQIELIRKEKQEKILIDNEKNKMKEEDKRSRLFLSFYLSSSISVSSEVSSNNNNNISNNNSNNNIKNNKKDNEKLKSKEEEKLLKLKEKERIKLEKEKERERIKLEKEELLKEKIIKENLEKLKQLKIIEDEKLRIELLKEKEMKENLEKIKRNQLIELKIIEKEKEKLEKEKLKKEKEKLDQEKEKEKEKILNEMKLKKVEIQLSHVKLTDFNITTNNIDINMSNTKNHNMNMDYPNTNPNILNVEFPNLNVKSDYPNFSNPNSKLDYTHSNIETEYPRINPILGIPDEGFNNNKVGIENLTANGLGVALGLDNNFSIISNTSTLGLGILENTSAKSTAESLGLGFNLPITSSIPTSLSSSTFPQRSITNDSFFVPSLLDNTNSRPISASMKLNTSLSVMTASSNKLDHIDIPLQKVSSDLGLQQPIDMIRTNSYNKVIQPKPSYPYSYTTDTVMGLGVPITVTSPNNLSEIPLSRSTSQTSVNSRITNSNSLLTPDILGIESMGVSLRGLGLGNIIIDPSDSLSRPSSSNSTNINLIHPDINIRNEHSHPTYSPRDIYSSTTHQNSSINNSNSMDNSLFEGLIGKKTSSQLSLLSDDINMRTYGSDLNASAPLWNTTSTETPYQKSQLNHTYSNGLGFELRPSYTSLYDFDTIKSTGSLQMLPNNFFPEMQWLKSYGIGIYTGGDGLINYYALLLTSFILPHFNQTKIEELKMNSRCLIKIITEYINGVSKSFLIVTRDGFGESIAMRLINDYLRTILMFGSSISIAPTNSSQQQILTNPLPFDIKDFPPLSTSSTISSTTGLSLGGLLGTNTTTNTISSGATEQILTNLPILSTWAKSSNNNKNINQLNDSESFILDDYTGLLQSQDNDLSNEVTDDWVTLPIVTRTIAPRPESLKIQANSKNYYHRVVAIPREAVGVVIGQGGKKIKEMCQLSGAKIQFRVNKSAEREKRPGVLDVQGSYDTVETAMTLIWNLLQPLGKEYKEFKEVSK